MAASGAGRGFSIARLPTGGAGRRLAAGLLVLVLALSWLLAGSPLRAWYRERATVLDGRVALEARMRHLAGTLPALRERARALAGAGPASAALIEGASDAVAGAALQERVQQMAASLGATLSSTETLASTDSQTGGHSYRRVAVRISVTASFEVMVRLVAAIEQASPSMLIDDLQLHGSRIQLLSTAPLEGTLTVLAFRRAGPGEPDRGRPGAADTAPPGDPAPDDAPEPP